MTPRSPPLVSVVTPVYNGAAFLRDCIESVLAQTYANWDYTIVDNCSTDGTLEIAREYADRDPRIRVRTNETFLRVIANYNMAFRQISPASTYCKVVAADDMILPECLEQMVRVAEAHPTVAIVGAHGVYSRASMGIYCSGVPYPQEFLVGREICRSYLLGKGPAVFGPATFVLYRSSVVRRREAFYNESNFHADSESFLEVLADHDFGFVHQVLTFMRIQDDSLSSLSERLNTNLPYWLYALLHYGPTYLREDELRGRVEECLKEYYAFLGWQLPKRRGKEFWEFHRGKLEALGHPLSRTRLLAATTSYVVDAALNPKRSAEAALARIAGPGGLGR